MIAVTGARLAATAASRHCVRCQAPGPVRTLRSVEHLEVARVARRAALQAPESLTGIAVARLSANAVVVTVDRDVIASALGAHESHRRRQATADPPSAVGWAVCCCSSLSSGSFLEGETS